MMTGAFRNFFRTTPSKPLPEVPSGQRVYAIGDVHGEGDLFEALVSAVEHDDACRPPARTTLILLGDLIDRGPDSAGVINSARRLRARRPTRILMGNHEEMFLRCFTDLETLRHFLIYGGRETLLSYPIGASDLQTGTLEEVQALMLEVVPKADLDFIRSFRNYVLIGDYLFVHAGVVPDRPLAEQSPQDLRWIRQPFLKHKGDFGHVVVHGHSIAGEAEIFPNRIGIDTGAYKTGRLTALGLEGNRRWLIEATGRENAISTSTRPA
jgi:serine/threonine protein phosphatase 1